jgi:hypothetical protein
MHLLLVHIILLLMALSRRAVSQTVSPTPSPVPTPVSFPVCATLPAGTACTLFGTGAAASGSAGDGGAPWLAQVVPTALALAPSGLLLAVSDNSARNIRLVDLATFTVSSLVPPGGNGSVTPDGPTAVQNVNNCFGLAVSASGDVFFTETVAGGGQRVRVANASTARTRTLAGSPTSFGNSGDGGAAVDAKLQVPNGLALDEARALLFLSDGNGRRVRVINLATGIIANFAGMAGSAGSSGDGGPAAAAQLTQPFGLALDAAGNLFIADAGAAAVRRVDRATGIITAVMGNSTTGSTGDGGPSTSVSDCGEPRSRAVYRRSTIIWVSDGALREWLGSQSRAGRGGAGEVVDRSGSAWVFFLTPISPRRPIRSPASFRSLRGSIRVGAAPHATLRGRGRRRSRADLGFVR